MRVVYALDLDEADIVRKVALACAWATRLGGTLDLLHVDTRDASSGSPSSHARLRHDGENLARLDVLLREVPSGTRGLSKVAHAPAAADAIVALANPYDLVIVGTHRRTGWDRLLEGSVAGVVVRACPRPVLVLGRPDSDEVPQHVLVAVDALESHAGSLVGAAAEWAMRLDADLALVHVVTGSASPEEAGERLRRLAASLPSAVRATVRVEQGDPRVALAGASGSDALLVLRTHGRRGLGRLWWGSVSEHVTRLANGPVLVLPPRKGS
jgi:nucleotide-binding universal stress UspA family protein